MSSLPEILREKDEIFTPVVWSPPELDDQQVAPAPSPIDGESNSTSPTEFSPWFPALVPPDSPGEELLECSSNPSDAYHEEKTTQELSDFAPRDPIARSSLSTGGTHVVRWAPQEIVETFLQQDLSNHNNGGTRNELYHLAEDIRQRALEEANQEAERIITQAQEQATEIIQVARNEAADITHKAYLEGKISANSETLEMITMAQKIVSEVQLWKEKMLVQSEAMVVELIQNIAQKLFGEGVVLEEGILRKAFEHCLKQAKSLGDLRIRIHPEDLAMLSPVWAEQQSALRGQRLELVPDEDIERGGCYIDGQYGSLDARVRTQLRLITDTLGTVLAGDGRPIEPLEQATLGSIE